MMQAVQSRKLDRNSSFSDPAFSSIKIVVGIGNPGSQYAKTRHNVGFMVLDRLEEELYGSIVSKREDSLSSEFSLSLCDRNIRLFKPKTFVNKTGDLLRKFLKSGLKAEEVLIVHDELEKPLGYVGVKKGGSHKGHNGLKSVQDAVGPGFWRLFVGIGRPERGTGCVSGYVLSKFAPSEQEPLAEALNLISGFFTK